jgi:dCTP deaminase
MILTGNEIKKQHSLIKIHIEPFDSNNVTTNSYDLTLGDSLIYYTDDILDPKKENNYSILKIPEEGYLLEKGSFYLGSSQEVIGSDFYVPIIHAKSGIARLGLFVHVTADLIDIGSHGNITFQLHATLPVKIYKGMKLGQVTFWRPEGSIELYSGKYQNSIGPQASRSYKDHTNN